MDVVGSEIGQKMRSAIKAKLTELGCYVDDELPDYVMVMVANKRTRSQMEDDLQLFLGDNTELFVNWLHQVLKKLQEVTVAPLKADEKNKKDSKTKEKKDKSKKGDAKKSKKKEKEKARKKLEKKSHKSKKKSKHQEILRPNIPPLLMNMEKPEPSITDVFAGQILKNHGVTLEPFEDTTKLDVKIRAEDVKRPIVPIIDPATIPSQSEIAEAAVESQKATSIPPNREEQLKEIDAIEAKMQGLKQKLAEQLDSMSDDEDFLNIRTEAEELMNDFAEDVFQEISQPPPATPPILPKPTPAPIQTLVVQPQKPQETITPETLPQIELNLPKRPIRERLGARDATKVPEKEKVPAKVIESPERLTPEREPEFRPSKSAKSRLGSQVEMQRKTSVSDESDKSETKKVTSKVSVSSISSRARSCASVVRVRPRPRVAPASSLLLRAVADAHKSLLSIPPKVDPEPQTVKRALVLPMRRCVDAQKIVIQVAGDATGDSRGDSRGGSHGDSISLGDPESDSEISSKLASDITDRGEPLRSITKVITNTEYVPSKVTREDDIIDTINIHNTTVDKSKDTQFIVTMDGYHPNSFLAKKLMTEGLLDEDDNEPKQKKESKEKESRKDKDSKRDKESKVDEVGKNDEVAKKNDNPTKEDKNESIGTKKRLSDTSEDSATQVIINQEKQKFAEKRKSIEVKKDELKVEDKTPPPKKRRASPIVFDVDKKEKKDSKEEKVKEKKDDKAGVRERTISASSDSHVVLTTPPNPHKYDAIPPLSAAAVTAEKPWCRAFPLCRFGAACAFAHPRCRFAAACTRRACPYSHEPAAGTPAPPLAPAPPPQLASHVVPAANYKSISGGVSLCKFYPGCVNPACHYYHPKPCRYGRACANRLDCNFYHHDAWKYSA